MEASGGYERLAHHLLTERGLQAAIVNPARVRHFAKAAGLLARPTGSMPWRSPATAPSPGRRRCRRGHGRPWPPCSAARPRSARCWSPPSWPVERAALDPELGCLDRRRIASLVGLAPVAKGSGQKRGRRAIQGGRGAVRQALDMAVVSASRGRSRLAVAYRALVARGKPAKVALTAVMRKLLVALNAGFGFAPL